MLGIKKIASGRMGNRLFHYNFLRQISKKTGIDYFCINFAESEYFDGISKRGQTNFRFKKTIKMNSKDVLSFSPEEFIKFIICENNKGKDIVFYPQMLGEVFFDYLFFDPNKFFKVKEPYKKKPSIVKDGDCVVGLHFRGTDFLTWNKNAYLSSNYYKKAIDFCIDSTKDTPCVYTLFTDDLQFPAYIETMEYLRKLKVKYCKGNTRELPIYDFYQLTQSDILISSPSTFAIFAGILGKQKKVIHSKNWLDYAVDLNDTFWVRLSTTQNPYYSIWTTF